MQRNIGLDLLKSIACISVVILHVAGIIATNDNNYTINHTLYYTATIAVPIFFMVNGYLLLNKKNLNYKYIIKKISNILLVIFAWNIIIFLGDMVIKKKISNPFYLSLENLMQKDYFWQFWFFGALIIIYIFLPIIYRYFNSNYKNALLITSIFIIISFGIDLLSLIRSIKGFSIIQINVIQTFRIWTWFSYYLLGGLIGKTEIKSFILKKINFKVNLILVIIMTVIVNIYEYTVSINVYHNPYAEFFYDNIFVFIWIISLFALIYRQDFSKNKYKSIIEFISNNSMGVYILHVTTIRVITHFYEFNKPISNICLIFIVFISTLIVSAIIAKLPVINKLVKL
jgi:surface polysaccharide O-acyltransferase-like enzyme